MNRKQIDRYFELLAKLYTKKCRIILTGAAAGALYGRVRSTVDIDFAAKTRDWELFSRAVSQASARTGIVAQYAEDIDRWSMITLLDYDKHLRVYRRIGSIEVCLMEPRYWAIGKLSRYLDSDVQDISKVFKKTKTTWRSMATLCGKALKRSPKSTACFLFKRQVEDFFKRFGKRVWGKAFDPEKAIAQFHKSFL